MILTSERRWLRRRLMGLEHALTARGERRAAADYWSATGRDLPAGERATRLRDIAWDAPAVKRRIRPTT